MPLLYSGQEADLQKRLRFFDKDTIPWKDYPHSMFYTLLFQLKKNNPALWNGKFGGFPTIATAKPASSTFAFSRKKESNSVYAVFNFSDLPQWIEVEWNEDPGPCLEVFTGQSELVPKQFRRFMQPWEFRIFTK